MIYFVPTPIGNLKDITLRALEIFREVDILFCEDTRTCKQLLQKYEINYSNKKFFSITSYTKNGKLNFYLELMKENNVAIVSEAGTPGLSDPGKELIRILWENNIDFDVLPGANALIPASVSACFDTSKFLYLGFLPIKKGRQTTIKKIIESEYPVFIYESVYRVEKTLNQLKEFGFTGKIFIIREISKLYQQKKFGTVEEILERIKSEEIKLKGEFVIGIVK